MEEQQNIPELTINENGELLTYTLNNMKLTKHIANGMYTLESVANLLSNTTQRTIAVFLSSLRFRYILRSYDVKYSNNQFVYYIQHENYIKIGKTFDIKQRYQPKEIQDKVKRLIFVNRVSQCEQELIKTFSERYKRHRGREAFAITSTAKITESLKLFDSIVKKYKTKMKRKDINHVQKYKYDKTFGTGYYISPLTASIILNVYGSRDYRECRIFIDTIEGMDRNFNKSDYISTFTESGEAFFYWKYHGYVVIVNMDRNLINASRLWNTILKAQGKYTKKNQFKRYLDAPRTKAIIKHNPEAQPKKLHYTARPLLNGRYMPIVFAHFILDRLDAKYSYEVAKMMTETLYDKARTEARKQITSSTSGNMSGGNILQIKKLNTINKLIQILSAPSPI